MLLDRADMKLYMESDLLRAANILADASPITGLEIMGMVLELIFKNGTISRRFLPGCAFFFQCTTAFDKTMALVWALWLVAGPDIDALRYLFSKVTGIVTDQGVESRINDAPDVLPAFFAWINGSSLSSVGRRVNYSVNLFPTGVRLLEPYLKNIFIKPNTQTIR